MTIGPLLGPIGQWVTDSEEPRTPPLNCVLLRSAYLLMCAFLIGCATGTTSADWIGQHFEEVCSEVACRPILYVHMMNREGGRLQIPVLDRPYVHNGRIHVLRGEEFRVVPTIFQNEIAGLSYLGDSLAPNMTFDLSLQREGDYAVLEFENPFSHIVLFRAAAIDSESFRQSDERICALGPQEHVSGRWSRGIDGIVIYEMAFVDTVAPPIGTCW